MPRLYASLCKQTSYDFKWLVIDDGSTDKTAELVRLWSEQAAFEIQYIYKENGGVHTARELAYKTIETELNVGIDSDDFVKPEFVETILSLWVDYSDRDICGIILPVCTMEGDFVGEKFPDVKLANWQDFTYKYHCTGDHTIVVRSDIMKSMEAFPIFPEERLVGECFKWIQLPEKPFIISKQILTVIEYLPSGYSSNVHLSMIKNPKGAQANALQHIKYLRFKKAKIKQYIKYIICSIYSGDHHYIRKTPHPIITVFFWPIGRIGYLAHRILYCR